MPPRNATATTIPHAPQGAVDGDRGGVEVPLQARVVLGGLGAVGAASAYVMFDHVASRINRFWTGEGDTFQTDRAREAILNCGWLGQGPGEGTGGRLWPDRHTDFAFSVLAEESPNVHLIDLGAVLDESGADGAYARPDGLHLEIEAAERLTEDLLAADLLALNA